MSRLRASSPAIHLAIWVLLSACVGADEGDLLWFDGRVGENLEATPAVDSAGNVYVAASDDLWSFDALGNLRWHYEHPGDDAVFGESSSPALGPDETTVYLACYAGVFAFRASDGELLWERAVPDDFPQEFATTPALSADGSRLYVGAGDNLNPSDLFYCLDSADGSVIWVYDNPHPPQEGIRGYLGGASVGADGTIYVASQHGWLISLTDDGDNLPRRGNNEAQVTENWARVVGNECRMPPAIDAQGFVYVGAGTGELRKFDGETGQEVTSGGWPILLGGEIFEAQAVGADGTLYTGNENERVYAFRPDGTLQWSYDQLESWPTDPLVRADGAILFTADIEGQGASVICLNPDGTLKWSTPFITTVVENETNLNIAPDGTLFVSGGDEGGLYAFAGNGQGLAVAPWPKYHRDGGNAGNSNISSGGLIFADGFESGDLSRW